jgi:hypothetical protein
VLYVQFNCEGRLYKENCWYPQCKAAFMEKKKHVLSTIVQLLDVITSFNFNFFFAVLFEVNVDGVSIF